MADKELLYKMIALQDRIFEQMEPLEKEDVVPSALEHAKDKAIEWAKAVQKEEGNDKSYREWPPKQLAHELKKNLDLFGNHEGTQWVREYEELVGKLLYDHDREHV